MVLAYHLVFCTYGFWLPNDPRGSWSDFVGSWELLRFGRATTTSARQSVASAPHDPAQRERARQALKYPPVTFDGTQARAAAVGFADYTRRSGLPVYACAILPEHVHLVVGRTHLLVERVADQLKVAATRQLNLARQHPLAGHTDRHGRTPPPWARGQWKVFLNRPMEVQRAVRYVEQNPVKEGKRPQHWGFVRPYVG